jgi:hypothetical protein
MTTRTNTKLRLCDICDGYQHWQDKSNADQMITQTIWTVTVRNLRFSKRRYWRFKTSCIRQFVNGRAITEFEGCSIAAEPLRWKYYDPSKGTALLALRHGITSHKTWIFINQLVSQAPKNYYHSSSEVRVYYRPNNFCVKCCRNPRRYCYFSNVRPNISFFKSIKTNFKMSPTCWYYSTTYVRKFG